MIDSFTIASPCFFEQKKMNCVICKHFVTRQTGVPVDEDSIVCGNLECGLAYFEQSRTRYVETCEHCGNEYERNPHQCSPDRTCPPCLVHTLWKAGHLSSPWNIQTL